MVPAESLPGGLETAATPPVAEGPAPSDAAPPTLQVLGDSPKERGNDGIRRFDFRQPAFLTSGQLRKLRSCHEELIRSLSARLAMYLRLEVNLRLTKLQTVAWKNFIEGLPNPTYLTLFKAEPLRGICILDIPPRLGLSMVDRLLGGSAQGVNHQRDVSEIESALLDQVVQIVLGEWCGRWATVMELRPVTLGHESNGQFLEFSSPDAVLITLAMEARVGDCTETIQLGFPAQTLEPLVEKLAASPAAGPTPASSPVFQPQWNRNLEEVKIPVTAAWLGLEISVRKIAQFKVGDVIHLPAESVNQVELRLANVPKFVGRLGTRGNQWAVETTQILKS